MGAVCLAAFGFVYAVTRLWARADDFDFAAVFGVGVLAYLAKRAHVGIPPGKAADAGAAVLAAFGAGGVGDVLGRLVGPGSG